MAEKNWYLPHLWVIGLQIITLFPYMIGSIRFYRQKNSFMFWLALGICLDIILAISASSGVLPRMNTDNQAPWNSWIFLLHIVLAGIGMFGFIILFIFLLFNGHKKQYSRLRKFQLKVLLNCWLIGVGIALFNFGWKIAFGSRLYDLL